MGIPNDMELSSQVEGLYVFENQFTGTIPEFGKNMPLKSFLGYGNQFKGTIPETISELSNLLKFEVESNSLSGTVPGKMGKLPELSSVKVQFNSLTGTIPVSLCFLESMEVLESDCDENLTSSIILGKITTTECHCCTTCCNPITEEC